MIIRKPRYFDSFHCLAGKCPDSCCHQWTVQIDEDSAQCYRNLSGELGDALRASLAEEDGDIILRITDEGKCPMWRADGLCRIQAEIGEEYLSCVCKEFPRLTHDYGSFCERGLELSCPEAARLIIQEDNAWIEETVELTGESDYEHENMEILLSSREKLLEILGNRSYTVPEVLAASVLFGYHAQMLLDGEEPEEFEIPKAIAVARELITDPDSEGIPSVFKTLEILTPEWRTLLDKISQKEWDDNIRRIAQYFVQRYYLQAISDFDIVCRVKFMVISCILIHMLDESTLRAAQLYSKEIENDIDNLDAILDGCYTESAFSDRNLISCLLCN